MSIETPFGSLIDLRNDLAELLGDVHVLRICGTPEPSLLDNAPLLLNWSAGGLFTPCLIGEVVNHPLLGNRPSIHTSQIVAANVEQGWARTWSRYYRLGSPAIERDPLFSGNYIIN
jgi:hypothetical protein